MPTNELQDRKIHGVLGFLREYLEARFDHACRVNPSVSRVRDDLLWHELASVSQVLAESKAYGPDRPYVIDILTSFDPARVNSLILLTDQHTIFNEIVTEAEKEKKREKMDALGIRDIGEFYKSIDPTLEKTVLLVQTWIWWDLRDAVDLYLLDLLAERTQALGRENPGPERLRAYCKEANIATGEATVKEILAGEAARARDVGAGFEARRRTEPGFQVIIKRDALPDEEYEKIVVLIGQHLKATKQIVSHNALDPPQREFYAKLLHCAPESVTVGQALECEREVSATLMARLRSSLASQKPSGEPYNFKTRQAGSVREKVARIEAAASME